ncbi:MAG: hypothetical protein GXO57_09135 [Thermodesulfobacteria bacterium]|nr:hypothetical protein [Thermodesulfobacteriota bacterium]
MENRFPKRLSSEERREVEEFLYDRFGIPPNIFTPYEMLRGVSNFWLYPKTELLEVFSKLQVQTVGLLFLRKVSVYLKPTSAFLQRFGYTATKNIVELPSETIRIFKEKKRIEIDLDVEPGYVILKDSEGWILGCALYINGKLISYLEEKLLRNL